MMNGNGHDPKKHPKMTECDEQIVATISKLHQRLSKDGQICIIHMNLVLVATLFGEKTGKNFCQATINDLLCWSQIMAGCKECKEGQ